MSITNCPHCNTELDPAEDSIYCENCGGNIMRQPPAQEKRVLFTPHIWVRVENGEVITADIDWTDTCAGENGEGHNETDPDELAACKFVDDAQRQERVLNALIP